MTAEEIVALLKKMGNEGNRTCITLTAAAIGHQKERLLNSLFTGVGTTLYSPKIC